MSAGGNERFNFIIGAQFQPGDAVARFIQTLEQMRAAGQQFSKQPLTMFDQANNTAAIQQARNLARQIHAAMEGELRVDLLSRYGSRVPAGQPGGGQFRQTALTPKTQQLFEASLGPVERATKTYAEQLTYAAKQLRVSALRADEDTAKARIAAARELETHAGLARATNTLANAREREAASVLRQGADEAAALRKEQEALGQVNLALQRRKDADDKAAAVAAENARADASAGTFQSQFTRPDLTSALGVAQAGVNQALRRQQIAIEQHNVLMARTDKTLLAVQQSEARLAAADDALTRARQRESVASVSAGQGGGFGAQFGQGFKGASERPYAEQLGQAFKFSLFYGTAYKLLSALTQTFQQTLQEGIAFQQAVSELKLSAGRADDSMDTLANNLGDQAVQAGQAPSTGVLIGARSLGLYGATQAPAAAQARIAEESARVVSRLALSSGQSAEELQTNIAAIVNAFGGGAEAQFRVADIDAYMAQRFGVAPGSTIQAVSEAGTVGAAAGFNQEQVNAIAAALMARTGQTAPAVAGFMAQIFSRGGEGSLTQVAGRYGIDPTAELSTQIKELAQVYKTASPQERAELSAAFGRGKVQNAAIALLQTFDDVEKAAKDAQGGAAAGKADQAFNLRMSNIGGQIQLTTATLKEFANQLGQSGVLTALGAAVVVFRDLVEAGTGLLKLWNDLSPAVREVLVALGLLTLAARTNAAAQLLQGRIGGLGLFRSAGGAYGAGAPIAAGRLAVATEAGAVPLASGAGAAAIGAAIAPLALAVGSLAAVFTAGTVASRAGTLDTTAAATTALLGKGLGPGATADDLRARSAALDASARDADEAAHGIFAHIVDLGQASDRDYKLADDATAEAARLRQVAALKERQDAAAAANQTSPLITGFDTESLSTSLDAITASGGNAKDRLDALSAALLGNADAATAATDAFNAQLFAGQGAQSIQQRLAQSPLFVGRTEASATGRFSSRLAGFQELAGITIPGLKPDETTTNALPDAMKKVLTPSVIQQRLQDALTKGGITSLAGITPEVATQIATSVVGTTPEEVLKSLGISDPESIGKVRTGYVAIIKHWLRMQSKSVRDIVHGHLVLSPEELTATIGRITSDTQELLNSLPESDSSGRIQAARRQVQQLRAAIRLTPGPVSSQAQDALNAARILLSNQQIDEMENLRRAAQQNARSKAQVAARGRSFLTREVNTAIRAGNQDRLVQIIQVAGAYGIRIAQQAINQAIRTAQAAIDMATEINSASNALLADATIAGQKAAEASRSDLARYRHLRRVLTRTPHGNASTDVYRTGSDANLPASLTDTGADSGPTAAQIAAARQSAYAQGSESQIAEARASIASARADMAAAKKGTTEYYQALGAYLSARNELTDAIQAYRQNLFLLHHDITNPLTQARAETRAAAAKLRSDAGKPADVRAADRVSLEQAQAGQEAAAFQQRLETVQTAEQLGRVSHQAYIRYLQNESRRLNNIKDRTYQQQQELNQIDGLLQDAAKEMEGQFNIAGIKLPTVYQVRRAIAERSGDTQGPGRSQLAGRAAGQVNSNNTTYIQIDGADYTKVKRLVTDEMGKAGRVVTGAPRRRV